MVHTKNTLSWPDSLHMAEDCLLGVSGREEEPSVQGMFNLMIVFLTANIQKTSAWWATSWSLAFICHCNSFRIGKECSLLRATNKQKCIGSCWQRLNDRIIEKSLRFWKGERLSCVLSGTCSCSENICWITMNTWGTKYIRYLGKLI